MRIAHIVWCLSTGGVETMIADIVSCQSKEATVALFVVNDRVEDFIVNKVSSNVKLYLIGRKVGGKNPWPILKLNMLMAWFRPDIIHTHSYEHSKIVFTRWIPMVRTIHNTNNLADEYPLYKRLFSISYAVRDFTEKQGFDSVVVENGIAISSIRNSASKVFFDEKCHFVQVSRLDIEQKGQDVLINALNILKNEFGFDQFVMHFIGEGNDKHKLENMASDMNLSNNIIFEGLKPQPWLYEHLCDYDLFIQPSRYEGFGLTVAEAIAAKVPVLVSNIEGPLEIIDGGRLGMTFRNMDYTDCAKQIKSFVEKGKDNIQVEEAYQYVVDHYDVSITAKKYLEVYKTII